MIERIAILGTGLIGASVGLALRGSGFKGTIAGWNRSAEGGETALKLGAVDSLFADGIEAARQSQVVVLAVPIYATLDWMARLSGVLGPGHLVTDVGSTKAQITAAAMRQFNSPSQAGFLPGHPMAGKEKGGAELADAHLFRGAAWLFTDGPAPQRSAASSALAHEWRNLVEAMGAKAIDIEAARHDELVGWVSHLPQFLATVLSALLEDRIGEAPELKQVGGRALREMTRLGASPYSMWRDIAYTNSQNLHDALLALEQRLAHLRENLRTPELREEFERANRFRRDE